MSQASLARMEHGDGCFCNRRRFHSGHPRKTARSKEPVFMHLPTPACTTCREPANGPEERKKPVTQKKKLLIAMPDCQGLLKKLQKFLIATKLIENFCPKACSMLGRRTVTARPQQKPQLNLLTPPDGRKSTIQLQVHVEVTCGRHTLSATRKFSLRNSSL